MQSWDKRAFIYGKSGQMAWVCNFWTHEPKGQANVRGAIYGWEPEITEEETKNKWRRRLLTSSEDLTFKNNVTVRT